MSLPEKFTPLASLIDLNDKGAVVTGGAMGIGFGIACRLAEAGAAVCIADLDAAKGEQAAREIQGYGYKAISVPCDVTDEEKVREAFASAAGKMGRIDVLVNNAGIYPRRPLAETTAADFDKVMGVNLKGAFLCSLEASRQMTATGRGGCIINIASIEALHPSSRGLSAYDASKGGLLTLTKSLARELGRQDIRVNAVAPGGILTENLAARLSSQPETPQQGRAELKAFMARMVLGRMGNADDVARVVLFLASDLSAYMTGSLVVVDGGYLIS